MAGRRFGRWTIASAAALGAVLAATVGAPASGKVRSHVAGIEVAHADAAPPLMLAGHEVDRQFDPASHDGVERPVDVVPDISTGTKGKAGLPSIHGIYAIPSDGASRFGEFAAMFQQDLRDASDLLEQSYGYALRLDERPSTKPGQPPVVDISSVALALSSSEIDAAESTFTAVRDELVRLGFALDNKKYVVWLDHREPEFCGQATRFIDERRASTNWNQSRSFALIYRPGNTEGPSGGFCRSSVVLHELGHAFGALLPIAPNEFDGAHCDDAENDVMCYTYLTRLHTDAPERESDPQGHVEALAANAARYPLRNPGPPTAVFDFNNDDYWDAAANPALRSTPRAAETLPWWTANLSRFLCPPAEVENPCLVGNEPFARQTKPRGNR